MAYTLLQVPMDLEHVRSFMNISLSGTFISKMTIMHAYQTCIKRIVRFANSLQVKSRLKLTTPLDLSDNT